MPELRRALGMLWWFVRRGFWDLIAWGKFIAARPLDIKPPKTKGHVIVPKRMIAAIPEVPLHNVMVCARADIPKDELGFMARVSTVFYCVQVWLYTHLMPPMQRGVPPIDADPQDALNRAF